MADENTAGGMGAEQERERRLDALRQIASQQGGSAPSAARTTASALSPAAGKRRPLRILGLVALVVCVVLAEVAALYVTHRGAPHATASPIHRVIVSDGDLGCVFGARYSPDGKTLAVLAGPVQGCNSTDGQPSYPTSLMLYDVARMKPTRAIELDNTILAAAKVPAGMHIVGGIGLHTNFLWSADSQRIALFWAGNLAPLGSTEVKTDQQNGVAIIATGTQAIQVISASSEPVYPSTPSISPSSYIPTWTWLINLSAGTMRAVQMPQALAYQWQASDTVAVETPMPASPDAAPAQPTDGPLSPYGTTIDMWQGGAAVSEISLPCAQPYFQIEMAGVVAWSPDGNAIFESGYAGTRSSAIAPTLPTPTPAGGTQSYCTPATLAQTPTADHLAFVAPRDPGMREALHLIKADHDQPTEFGVGGLVFNWSRDSKRVSVTPISTADDVTPYVAIYDSASGRQLAQYSATTLDPLYRVGGSVALLLDETWSPDGKTLLVADNSTLIFIQV